jgi:hypothetical protein
MVAPFTNPSAENQAKFNLVPLPEGFEPTKEETNLMSMYAAIRAYERKAARLKEQKAREKLDAKQAEFKQSQAPKQKHNRKKREKPAAGGSSSAGGRADGSSDESSGGSESGDDDAAEDVHARRAAKLEDLRDEVEEKKQALVAKEMQEESLRAKFLATATDDTELGPMIKKKRVEPAEGAKSSLLAGMKIQTPPHDFSEKLGLKPWKGKVLFPSADNETKWTPPAEADGPNDGAFLVELDNFDITKASNGTGNNTIAVKFSAPADSKRFRYVPLFGCLF